MRFDFLGAAFGVIACAIPLALVHAYDTRGVEAACDEGVVRVLGRGYTGVLRGLDALMPSRGALACALCLALATFLIARRLVRAAAPGLLGLALAVVASTLASTTFPAQREALLVSGGTIGALLVMLPIALASEGAPQFVVFGALGLASTYDVAIATSALASIVVLFGLARTTIKPIALSSLALGAIPIAWMMWRRNVAAESSIEVGAFASAWGEGAMTTPRVIAWTIARRELGVIALAFAAVGTVMTLRSRVTRPMGASLVAMVISGFAVSALGAPAGPARFGGALLASLAALAILSACGMATIVSVLARAKIPAARASAAMIVLLEVVVAVRVADDASLAMSKRNFSATARWNARVFGGLPKNAVLLLPTPRLFLRARAARAVGALAEDVIVIPTFGLGARATSAAIVREPLVAPLVRDLALYGVPEEFSLSELAATRPTLVAFDARWDKRFARHLVPEGAFDHYFVEPRGASERVKAFVPLTEDEVRSQATDELLTLATRDLVHARSVAAALTNEHDWIDMTAAELRRVSASQK